MGHPLHVYDKNLDMSNIHIQRILAQYRSIGVYISEEEDNTILIRQEQIKSGFVMTQKQLIDRARALYPDKKYKIIPVVYQVDLSIVTPEWLSEKMTEYSVRPNDFIAQLGLTKSEVSLFLSGKRPMSRVVRSAFFFYFLSFQLNRDLRGDLSM